MKTIYALFVIALIAIFVVGCTTTNTVRTTNDDTTPDTSDDTPDNTPDATLKQCTEAINYQVLIDALPTSVNGYVGSDPQGNMLTFTNPSDQTVMRYSTASISLQKDDKNIQVSLTDTCYIQYLSMAWVGFYEMEGTDGYLKKTTISGFPGWHQYSKSSESYSYNIFVKERVIVSVQGGNDVPDSDVTAAANAISYSSISAAAN